MSAQHQGSELDTLLDEALEEFEASIHGQQSAAPAAPSEPATAAEPTGASLPTAPEPDAAAGPAAPAAPPRPGAGGGGKGLAFNPLASRPPPRRGAGSSSSRGGGCGAAVAGPSAAAVTPASEAGSREAEEALRAAAAAAGVGDLGDVDELSAGLSKLLAELANVDDDTLAQAAADLAGRAEGGGMGAGGAEGRPAQRGPGGDLAATLRALAEQAPPGSAEEGGRGGTADPLLGGLGAHPEMASLVDSIMQQLLSKEVLYQPMKDIGARYPSWLEAHRGSLQAEELARYEQQYDYITQIVTLYESDPNDYAQLVNLLQQMQQCGQPPQEIVDELAPGMQFDAEGLPRFSGGGGPGGAGGGELPPELADCSIM